MKLVILSCLFILSSCANYINQLHRQIDTNKKEPSRAVTQDLTPEEKKDMNKIRSPFEDPFYYASYYKGKPIKLKQDLRPINDPKSMTSSGQPEYRKRYKANDFTDSGNDASLWSGKGKSRYLFSDAKSKEIGDIIVINVFESLKNSISSELKKNFGVPPAPKPVVAAADPAKSDPANPEAAEKKDPEVKEDSEDKDLAATNKVYDKISGLIVEEVNQDYLLVKGKKEVIFQKKSHEVGVQALVSRDDITENNEIPSDKMLETQVLILR